MEISKFLGPSVSVISQVILDGDTTFDLETKTFILNSTILTYLLTYLLTGRFLSVFHSYWVGVHSAVSQV